MFCLSEGFLWMRTIVFFFLESELEKKISKKPQLYGSKPFRVIFKISYISVVLTCFDHRDVINWLLETVEK